MGKESKKEWMHVYVEWSQFPIKLILIQYSKSTVLLYKLKPLKKKKMTSRDPWGSLDSQVSKYDAAEGRVGVEILTLSEIAFC